MFLEAIAGEREAVEPGDDPAEVHADAVAYVMSESPPRRMELRGHGSLYPTRPASGLPGESGAFSRVT